jgi:hypothetical protein
LAGVDYDVIRPGCVLPEGAEGRTVVSIEVYAPGAAPTLPGRHYGWPEDCHVVFYMLDDGATAWACIRPEFADRIPQPREDSNGTAVRDDSGA